jgi:phosphoenolpyruvate carboxylase
VVERLYAEVTNLWQTNELRQRRQTVGDEVRNGLYYFEHSLFGVTAEIYRDLHDWLARLYPGLVGRRYRFLTFGSWIGGDRDGNPNVTAEVTERTLRTHRALILSLYRDAVVRLQSLLTASTVLVPVSGALQQSLAGDLEEFGPGGDKIRSRWPDEPYRQKLTFMMARLDATLARNGVAPDGALMDATSRRSGPWYREADHFLADLDLIAESLLANGGTRTAGDALEDLRVQASVFRFHLASLDVRQHRDRIVSAVAEILGIPGSREGFDALPEERRMESLQNLIRDPPDLAFWMLTEETTETVETFRTVARMQEEMGAEAADTFIVSMATRPDDLLAVLALARIAGLFDPGPPRSTLRIVPLFETEDDLQRAPDIMAALYAHPLYARQLEAWKREQEIMLGYSDSDKDAGYVTSNWCLYGTQKDLTRQAEEWNIALTFFHGRGGAIGRGGGPLARAILGQPRGTVCGRLKVTEQGEVLFTRYANPGIAHRHLEQVINAVIRKSVPALEEEPEEAARWGRTLETLSTRGARVYRDLVSDDPAFLRFFEEGTPLRSIIRLRVASRPAARADGQLRLETLRAIPWVFAWIQARYGVPGWYGLGSALREAIEAGALAELRAMYEEWPFFRWLIDAAQISLGKADITIARTYAGLVPDEDVRQRLYASIEDEFQRTVKTVNAVIGQEQLLDSWPLLQRSIELRNPYVDPMSFIQVRMIHEVRAAHDDKQIALLRSLIDRSVAGIAAGLQNTG